MKETPGLQANMSDASLQMRCCLCGHMLSRPVDEIEADLKVVESETLDLFNRVTSG